MFVPGIWRFGKVTDPFSEMLRLRNEMNRLFSDATYTFEATYPAVNIWVNESGAIASAELPGMDVEKIDISVLGDTVTISGEREKTALKEEEVYHRKERNGKKFSRSLQLPFKIDEKKIEAHYEKGILHIALPREAAELPKKITIRAD